MPRLDLTVATADELSVRRFSIQEAISTPYEVTVVVRTRNEDVDLEAIVGERGVFRIDSGVLHLASSRTAWDGVVRHLEQIGAEPTGLSTYVVRLVPRLWLLSQRSGHRIFQHLSVPEIARAMLEEWQIEAELRVDAAAHPKHEFRVQYDETDLAFFSRLLEEAGIAYWFERGEEAARLVLGDAPQSGPRRHPPIAYAASPLEAAERELVSDVRLVQRLRQTKVTIRDHDFRRPHDVALLGEARAGGDADRLERFEYRPGAAVIEVGGETATPVADARAVVRHEEKEATALAQRRLESARVAARTISFRTNAVDLAPGVVFTTLGHPRSDLGAGRDLLVLQARYEGHHGDDWTITGLAVHADAPYRPEVRTRRPRAQGVESAIVVGPPGEEIHTDEFGRVRVQFHWDREGSRDDKSSCWIRVAQPWAGAGFGVVAVPRVGQEVLVEFFGGDPDRPVIIGNVFNVTSQVPHQLPVHRTRTVIKTASTPGGNGSNELTFEDLAGLEQILLHAQRDLCMAVENDQQETVGHDRNTRIWGVDATNVGVFYQLQIDPSAEAKAEARHTELPPPRTALDMSYGFVNLEANSSSLRLMGDVELTALPNMYLKAMEKISLEAPEIELKGAVRVVISGATEVVVDGGVIKLNC